MKEILPILLLMVMSGVSAAPQTTFDPGLAEMEQEWCKALKAGDAGWFEEHLADDFTSISSADGLLHRKHEEIADMKSSTTIYDSLELSALVVRIEGNAGVVTGVNHVKGRDKDGNTFDVRLAFTDTYIRRAGRWQVWASQHTRQK
jgi:ketosteroid isomerase-like protein